MEIAIVAVLWLAIAALTAWLLCHMARRAEA
jgi:hypothetical protein